MNIESGILLHMGLNYILTPFPELDKRRFLAFQQALLDEGVDYGEAKHTENEITLTSTTTPLQVRIAVRNPPLGQLTISAPNPQEWVDMFGRRAKGVTNAFNKTWGSAAPRQIVAAESTIRYLYESSFEHAFAEIWEERLQQPQNALAIFGKAVGGGGLRLVMPANPNKPDAHEIEVKTESYLKDPRKIYVDVRFKWPQPMPAAENFNPLDRLHTVDNFIETKVIPFLTANRPSGETLDTPPDDLL